MATEESEKALADAEEEEDKTPPRKSVRIFHIWLNHRNLPLIPNTLLSIVTAPGNGGITATYRWTQALGDLMIMVPLPPGTKTKMLDVVFTNNKLKVRE